MPIPTCLTPECKERATHKGLCMKCYSDAKKLVEAKTTTWLELEMLGLATVDETKFTKAFKRLQSLERRKEIS